MAGCYKDNNNIVCFSAAGVMAPQQIPVLKQMFDRWIDEKISDEQVARVLEPVLRLIREGAFARARQSGNAAQQVFGADIKTKFTA